jgi:hypothetical protein
MASSRWQGQHGILMRMANTGKILHGFEHETLDAKARWFKSLTTEQRLQHLSESYNLAVVLNPSLSKGRDAPTPSPTVRVIKRAPS